MSIEKYRAHLEGLSYQELLGEELLNDEVQTEIEGRLDAIQSDLESMSYEELLGTEQLEDLAQAEIESRLDAIRNDLDGLHIEDLLPHEYLEHLAQEEIDKRLAEFDHLATVREGWHRTNTVRENPTCPRCGGPIPSAEHAGEYPGGISRVDNETEICSACSEEEAWTWPLDPWRQEIWTREQRAMWQCR